MEPEPLCLEVREALSHGLVMSVCRVLFKAIHVERRVSTGVGVCQPLKKAHEGARTQVLLWSQTRRYYFNTRL